MTDVVGVIESHHAKTETLYDVLAHLGNADVLLELLELGYKARQEPWAHLTRFSSGGSGGYFD